MTEVWRTLAEIGLGRYQVSSEGRVRRAPVAGKSARLINGYMNGPYRCVELVTDTNHRHRTPIHVLVAQAFLGPRPKGNVVVHLDSDDLNNRLSNLAYGTRTDSYNNRPTTSVAITDELHQEIFSLKSEGMTQKEISDEVGVSQATVSRVLKGGRGQRSRRDEIIQDARKVLGQDGDVLTINRDLLRSLLDAIGEPVFE